MDFERFHNKFSALAPVRICFHAAQRVRENDECLFQAGLIHYVLC